jgi:uncharacterized membrane protein YdjX (TVP38/TMEM64 family)
VFDLLRSPWARFALLLVVLTVLACSLMFWDPTRMIAAATGPERLPVALAVYTLGTLTFLPRPALNAAVGLLLGVTEGLAVALAASTLGAALAFLLGRNLGREALRPMLRAKVLSRLDGQLTDRGFRSVLLLRLIPGIPFQAINYGCAFSGVRLRPFTLATAIGIVPATAAYVVFGASAGSPSSPAFLISAGLIAALSLASLVSLVRARAALRRHSEAR